MAKVIKTAVILGVLTLAALMSGFTDLPDDHWAKQSVDILVSDGTVSGFEDGSFRPNDPVTRAQFVKMVGERAPERQAVSDLDESHWGYDVLMHSVLRAADGKLEPDRDITREEAGVYIYDCLADGAESTAPSVITRGLDNANEIGWVYEHGIMVGDDGLNLRLSDGMTRAEAAVLIVNSRSKAETTVDFIDLIPQDMLKTVFNGSGLFEKEYSADAPMTNGEAARAAELIRQGRAGSLSFEGEAPFEHKYANELKAQEIVLGEGRISAEFADAAVQPEDAYAMIAFAMAGKIRDMVGYGTTGNYYKDAKLASQTLNAPLTFAYENGIRPYAGGAIKSGAAMTHRSFAAMLLQYDLLWGLQSSVSVDAEDAEALNDEPMRYTDLPDTADMYRGILKSVPNSIYEKPLAIVEGMEMDEEFYPVSEYAFFYDFRQLFTAALAQQARDLKDKYGLDVRFTYYPQLVHNNGGGFTMWVKAEITGARDSAAALNEIFPGCDDTSAAAVGSSVWAEYSLDYSYITG